MNDQRSTPQPEPEPSPQPASPGDVPPQKHGAGPPPDYVPQGYVPPAPPPPPLTDGAVPPSGQHMPPHAPPPPKKRNTGLIVAVIAGGLALLLLLCLCGGFVVWRTGLFAASADSEGTTDPMPVEESPSPTLEGIYGSSEEPCELFDIELYEEYIGLDAEEASDDYTALTADTAANMRCRVEADDGAAFGLQMLRVEAWQYHTEVEAVTALHDTLDALDIPDNSLTESFEGPWQEGYWSVYDADAVYSVTVVVQDDNLLLEMQQDVSENLSSDDALLLTTEIAEQVMESLRE